MDKDLRRKDDEQLEELEKRFDRHLEIYSQNGKELSRLAEAVENHIEAHKDMVEKVNEMYAIFNDGKVGTKIIKWTFRLLVGIGSAVLIYKGIVK